MPELPTTQHLNQRSIALIGLSGSGKSTVARLLAARLGWPWADTDPLIEQLAGASIPDIFSQRGEDAFRAFETAALRQALGAATPTVIATGGGIVLRPENRELLIEHTRIIWLDAPAPQLEARLKAHDEERPLLAGDLLARLETLRQQRARLYAATADLQLDTGGLTPEAVVEQILHWLSR